MDASKPSISITFDQNFYSPGDNVTGIVIIESHKPIKATSIDFSIDGTARGGGKQQKYAESYQSSEVNYVKEDRNVWKATNGNAVVLSTTNLFQFTFPLPPDCPPSFEGRYGSIRYAVRVKLGLAKPWKSDEIVGKLFQVTAPLHFTMDHYAIENRVERTVLRNMVTLKATLSKPGYLINDVVPISLEIHNDSNYPIRKIRVHFHQISSYFAVQKQEIKCLQQLKVDVPVAPKARETVTVHLTIPNVPPTFHSTVIAGHYCVTVVLPIGPSVLRDTLRCELPLTVGSVPMIAIEQMVPSAPEEWLTEPSAPEDPEAPEAPDAPEMEHF